MIRSDKARDGILRASEQGLFEARFDRRWASRDDCPVFFFYAMFAELLAESCGALASAGKGYRAGDGGIESADDPEIDLAWFVVFMFQIETCRFEQATIVGRCTLDDPIGGLVEYE